MFQTNISHHRLTKHHQLHFQPSMAIIGNLLLLIHRAHGSLALQPRASWRLPRGMAQLQHLLQLAHTPGPQMTSAAQQLEVLASWWNAFC
jgi:hypothetical protein